MTELDGLGQTTRVSTHRLSSDAHGEASSAAEANWRRHWEFYEKSGSGVARHIIGLSFEISWTTIEDEGLEWCWSVSDEPEPAELLEQMKVALGLGEFSAWKAELERQAMALWLERGHDD